MLSGLWSLCVQDRAVLTEVTMPVSNGSKLLLACLLLTCHFCGASRKPAAISFTKQVIDSYTTDLHSLLKAKQDHILEDRAAKPRAQRQISEDSAPQSNSSFPFNVSRECSYNAFISYLNQLDTTCKYAVASLDTDNVTYLASQQSTQDMEVFCTEDCAGAILHFNEYCPYAFFSLDDYVRGVCSRHNRFRCGLSLAVDDGSVVLRRCFEQSNAFVRCRTSCKNALIDYSNHLGCCINTYYNDTYSTVGILQQSVPGLILTASPQLWDMCGIPYPSECPPNVLLPEPTMTSSVLATSPTPTPFVCGNIEENSLKTLLSDQCTALLSEFVKPDGLLTISNSLSSISELCSTSCAGKYVEQCTGDEVSDNLGLFCGRNNNQFCGQVLADSFSNITPQHNCGDTPTSNNCSSDCYTTLQSASSMLGCCVHALTLADPSVTGYAGIVEDSLWSKCNLELPEQCPDPFLSAVENNGATGGTLLLCIH